MELRDYIRIILKQKVLVLAITLILAAASYLYTARQPAAVDGSLTFTVVVSERPTPGQYNYDYYFPIQSAALFADLIDGWFGAPNFVSSIYEQAKLPLPVGNTRAAGKLFRSVKEIEKSPVVTVSIKTKDRGETETIIAAAGDAVRQEVEALTKQGKIPASFSVIISEPLILESKANPSLNAGFAAVVGLIFGSVVALGRHYFKEG